MTVDRLSVSLIAAVLAIAGTGWAMPAAATPVTSADTRSPVAFDQYAVNLGEVPVCPSVTATYQLTNRSDGPVTIAQLDESCGCVRPSVDRDTLAPGETAILSLRMTTANESPGPHRQTVTVTTETAGGKRFEQVATLRVTLPEVAIALQPKQLLFYQLRGQAAERTISVADFREQPATVTGVRVHDSQPHEPLSEFVTATLDCTGQCPVVRVSVREGAAFARRDGWVVLETTDPTQPRLMAPIIVMGPQAVASARPTVTSAVAR